jgi:hypothetical protein
MDLIMSVIRVLTSVAFAAVLFGSTTTNAEVLIKVGAPVAPYSLANVRGYSEQKITNVSMLGSWYALSFWSPGCVTCVQSFSKYNAIHEQLAGQLTWFMVGIEAQGSNTLNFYRRMEQKKGLTMPSTVDSTLFRTWGISSVPCILLIDPAGVVRAVTNGSDLKIVKLQHLLNGESVTFARMNIEDGSSITASSNKVDVPELYSSVLKPHTDGGQRGGYGVDRYIEERVYLTEPYDMAMVPLYAIYNYAYFGKWTWDATDSCLFGRVYPRPVLELEDTSDFFFDYMNGGLGTFDYSLSLPSSGLSKSSLMDVIKEDLRRAFGYKVKIERRKLDAWILTGTRKAIRSLSTAGGPRYATPGSHAAGYEIRNVPAAFLIGTIGFYLEDRHPEPFIDKTGIKGNIDFVMDADMTDIDDVREKLQEQGFTLSKRKHSFRVLVIKD